MAELNANGYNAVEGKIQVQNMVFNGRFDRPVTLARLVASPDFDVEYEPEQFPGAILRSAAQESGTLLQFASGSVVVMGCKSAKQAQGLADTLEAYLNALGAFGPPVVPSVPRPKAAVPRP